MRLLSTRVLRVIVVGAAALVAGLLTPVGIDANHQWGKYKWSGDGTPVQLVIGDNLTTNDWGSALDAAMADWDLGVPDSLDLSVVTSFKDASCQPTYGRIEVCNGAYGNNGWLGIAQIWAQGRTTIVQATTKVNDTYFAAPYYDTADWRRFVMCQEVGHDFGLDHQNEAFDNPNLGTCMDYTSDPGGIDASNAGIDNLSPNQHDFDQLASMYLNTGGGGGGKPGGGGGGGRGKGQAGEFPDGVPDVAQVRVPMDSPGQWGQLVRSNGRVALYDLDLGFGNHIFTFVVWAL